VSTYKFKGSIKQTFHATNQQAGIDVEKSVLSYACSKTDE